MARDVLRNFSNAELCKECQETTKERENEQLTLEGKPVTAHWLNSSKMGEVWIIKRAMERTNLAQWFKFTKLTEENAAEEKLIMSKTEPPKVETPQNPRFEQSVDTSPKVKRR